MNPITNAKNLAKLSNRDLERGVAGGVSKSWHDKYRDSAWIYIGGLSYDLTEGDVICVFSQYGEIININMIRDFKTGKSKGFAFLCYEDQRSTVLAVDNLNTINLANRTIRVDHVEKYKVPQERGNEDADQLKLWDEGVAPKPLPKPVKPGLSEQERQDKKERKALKKAKREKKKKLLETVALLSQVRKPLEGVTKDGLIKFSEKGARAVALAQVLEAKPQRYNDSRDLAESGAQEFFPIKTYFRAEEAFVPQRYQ